MVLLASTETEIFTTFPSPLEINTKHARLSTPNTKIRGKTHLFYFLPWKTNHMEVFWGIKIKNQRCTRGQTRSKKTIFQGHEIKVIQGHEINVIIKVSGTLCVKPHSLFWLFRWINISILPPKVPLQADLTKLPEAITQKLEVTSSWYCHSWNQAPW